MKPSLNMVLVVGTVTKSFPPRSPRGPALLKVKTERMGYGDKSNEVFADYVPVTCFGRSRDRCVSIREGDTVRVTGTVSERKGADDVYRTQIVADDVMVFGAEQGDARAPDHYTGGGMKNDRGGYNDSGRGGHQYEATGPGDDSEDIPF